MLRRAESTWRNIQDDFATVRDHPTFWTHCCRRGFYLGFSPYISYHRHQVYLPHLVNLAPVIMVGSIYSSWMDEWIYFTNRIMQFWFAISFSSSKIKHIPYQVLPYYLCDILSPYQWQQYFYLYTVNTVIYFALM